MKLDCFYELLVKDVETSFSYSDKTTNSPPIPIEMEDRKDVIKISHKFRSSKNFYFSYLSRTSVELAMAAGLLAWLCVNGFPVLFKVSASLHYVACNFHCSKSLNINANTTSTVLCVTFLFFRKMWWDAMFMAIGMNVLVTHKHFTSTF